jgi:hypothetical protein
MDVMRRKRVIPSTKFDIDAENRHCLDLFSGK